MYGPYKSVQEAYEAYAATLNREVPQKRFLQALHPNVSYATKHKILNGEIRVAFHLETLWDLPIEDPPSRSVTMPVRLRMENGGLRQYCALFHIDRPSEILQETHLELKDGWVNGIGVYPAWYPSRFPFPERVIELANRLQAGKLSAVSTIPVEGRLGVLDM
jgi:hypothetical protein